MDNHRVGKKKIVKQPCLQHPKERKRGREKKFQTTPEREGGETNFRQPERKRGRGKKIELRVNE